MKHGLHYLVTLVLMLLYIPAVHAEDGDSFTDAYGIVYYVISEEAKTCALDNGRNIAGSLPIPDRVNGYTVTEIGYRAFYRNETLTCVIIPKTVRSIGDQAFIGCSYLLNVYCEPANLDSYGNKLFGSPNRDMMIYVPEASVDKYKEKWSDVASNIVPEGYIPEYKMNDRICDGLGVCYTVTLAEEGRVECMLTSTPSFISGHLSVPSVIKGATVTAIYPGAIGFCDNLTSVSIPATVEKIYTHFPSDKSLERITVDEANAYYCSVDGVLYDKAMTEIVKCPQKRKGTFAIPSTVTSVGNDSFAGCMELTAVEIPSSVTTIGSFVFLDCAALASITIPRSVTSIGDGTFTYCTGLSTVYLYPSHLETYCKNLFNFCTQDFKVYVPAKSVKSYQWHWSEYADKFMALDDDFPYECGDEIFDANGFVYEVVSMEKGEECCHLIDMTAATGDVVIPSSVEGFTVTRVSGNCGENSTMTSVTIPATVELLGDLYEGHGTNVFSSCATMQAFYVEDGNPSYSAVDGVLFSKDKTTIMSYPSGREGGYTIPSMAKRIGPGAFSRSKNLTSIEIPENITEITEYAFENCPSLASVSISNAVTAIGDGAFANCTALTDMEIPASVTSIGVRAFAYCSSLASMHIYAPELEEYGRDAFISVPGRIFVQEESVEAYRKGWEQYAYKIYPFGCESGVTGDAITDELGHTYTITSHDKGNKTCMFASSRNKIQDVVIPDAVGEFAVTAIDAGAFSSNSHVCTVVIPKGIRRVGDGAFIRRTSLYAVYCYPESLEYYGLNAFNRVNAGCKIYVPAASLETYKEGWSEYADMIEPMDDAMTGIMCAPRSDSQGAAFNLAGQRVGAGYKGIVITGGRKSLRK